MKGIKRKINVRGLLIVALLLARVINSFSQTDVEFWFVAPEITIGHGDYPGGEPVYFRVSALDLDAQVRIYQPANPAGMDTTFTVPAKTTVSIDASPWINDLENKPANLVLNKGVHIVSNNLITVYYDEDEYWNQDIFALKGKNALGYEFYTPFNNQWRNGTNYTPLPYSAIDIVATEDNTMITITPTAAIVGHPAGVPFTIYLDKGETFSCTASSQLAAGHLGGSHVVSDKPIAVTLKDDSVWGQPQGCRDLVGDQTVPIVNAAGKPIVGFEYIVMRGKINLINPGVAPHSQTRRYSLTGRCSRPLRIRDNRPFMSSATTPRMWRVTSPSWYFMWRALGANLEEPYCLRSMVVPDLWKSVSPGPPTDPFT